MDHSVNRLVFAIIKDSFDKNQSQAKIRVNTTYVNQYLTFPFSTMRSKMDLTFNLSRISRSLSVEDFIDRNCVKSRKMNSFGYINKQVFNLFIQLK